MHDIVFAIGVFIGSFGVGYLLIVKVPQMLHTPLMSMTNAISAVVILGAISLLATIRGWPDATLVAAAIAAAAFNIVGGFIITERMLRMFKSETVRSRKHSENQVKGGAR
ncbi:MAG: NAD(P) transhydrogenase subunit alpha [Desulfobacterales bacterium]